MMQVMQTAWGNPASIHQWGERSSMVVERAREQLADLLNTQPDRLIFTSGGTESNNMAIWGIARTYASPQHLITTTIEHSAVALPINYLEQKGWQVTRLGVDRWGLVSASDLVNALRPNTVLVSIIYAHNEVGTIQAMSELGDICRSAGVLLHTDAVQAVGRIPIDLATQPIDLLSLSGHKFYAPQGIGALYIGSRVKQFAPLLLGGGQEQGYRSGSVPVALIAGLGTAAALAKAEMTQETQRLQTLRNYFLQQMHTLPQFHATGHPTQRLPNHLSFIHESWKGRDIVYKLNRSHIAISSGSACSSGKTVPSASLLAMGYSPESATRGIRLTMGRSTTTADLEETIDRLREITTGTHG